MASDRQRQYMSQLIPTLGTVAAFDPEALVQRERLGSDFCFEAQLPLFLDITSASAQLQKLDFDKVPYGVISQLNAPFQNIHSLLGQIAGFAPANHGNAIQARDSLTNSLEDQWNSIYIIVRTLLGAPSEEGIRKSIETMSSQISSAMQRSAEALSSLDQKKSELDQALKDYLNEKELEFKKAGEDKLTAVSEALDQVRKVAAEAGVSQNAIYFKIEAEEHRIAARVWLITLVLLIFLLIGFSVFGTLVLNLAGVIEPSPDAKDIIHWRYLAQKGLIVFCLFFGLIWAAKNYGASKHNYVVNRHRNNALGSFQAFAASAAEPDTKSAVLIQATQSIFAPQASGFVKNDGDNSPNSPIVEILRSVGGSKDK